MKFLKNSYQVKGSKYTHEQISPCSDVLMAKTAEFIIPGRGKTLEHRTKTIFKVIKCLKHHYKVFWLRKKFLSKMFKTEFNVLSIIFATWNIWKLLRVSLNVLPRCVTLFCNPSTREVGRGGQWVQTSLQIRHRTQSVSKDSLEKPKYITLASWRLLA